MATTPVDYGLLRAEPWWGREFAPPRLAAFYAGLRTYLGRGPEAVGGKGDNRHRYGYHRSREWVLHSTHSVYGAADYSVRDPRDRGGDDRWLSALDATPYTVETLIGMCRRLDAAVRAGELPQVREWYGNLDGDRVVDGWDSVRQRAAWSDSSHLWHLHISFFRSMADDDHTHLLAVLTGKDDDMQLSDIVRLRMGGEVAYSEANTTVEGVLASTNYYVLQSRNVILAELRAQRVVIDALAAALAAGGGSVDMAAIDTRLADLRAGIEADTRDAVADAAEGGAAAARAGTP